MKTIALLTFTLLVSACASNPQHARYGEEKNAPKFGNSRSYIEKPTEVRLAARAALDQLSQESDPPVVSSVKGGDDEVHTGWVYSISPKKFVEYKENDKPMRKPLRIRRKYTYGITPSLSGTQVTMDVEEEVIQLDLSTGEEKGWRSTSTDSSAYELMARRLQEKLRQGKS